MNDTGARFGDRREAGRRLATRLREGVAAADVVLGLAPGGVPVALELAVALGAPLDVFVVRPLPVPGDERTAMGAIAAGGVRVLDRSVLDERDVAAGAIEDVARREAVELARLERSYRGHRRARRITGRTVLLADDGLTTTADLRAAIDALAVYRPSRVMVALPVTSPETEAMLKGKASRVISVELREPASVASVYPEDLDAVSARDVRALLGEAEERRPRPRDRAALD
jgi:putative phosphoribosyl transferase